MGSIHWWLVSKQVYNFKVAPDADEVFAAIHAHCGQGGAPRAGGLVAHDSPIQKVARRKLQPAGVQKTEPIRPLVPPSAVGVAAIQSLLEPPAIQGAPCAQPLLGADDHADGLEAERFQ